MFPGVRHRPIKLSLQISVVVRPIIFSFSLTLALTVALSPAFICITTTHHPDATHPTRSSFIAYIFSKSSLAISCSSAKPLSAVAWVLYHHTPTNLDQVLGYTHLCLTNIFIPWNLYLYDVPNAQLFFPFVKLATS